MRQLGKLADQTIDYESITNDQTFQYMLAEHSKQLEVASELERMHIIADTRREEERERARTKFILKSQIENPLGLMNSANRTTTIGRALDGSQYVIDAQQTLEQSKTSEIAGIHENPPVYTEHDLFDSQELIDDPSFWPTAQDVEEGFRSPRCYQCFDPILPDVSKGFSGRACRKAKRLYHSECYFKTGAPECKYCGIPLVRNDERHLSGQWGIHNGEKYHVECYQLYAGPRCCVCFDVIFADPTKNRSGSWVKRKPDEFLHVECYNYLLKRKYEEQYRSGTSLQDATIGTAGRSRMPESTPATVSSVPKSVPVLSGTTAIVPPIEPPPAYKK